MGSGKPLNPAQGACKAVYAALFSVAAGHMEKLDPAWRFRRENAAAIAGIANHISI
jgi:hypothetical protein